MKTLVSKAQMMNAADLHARKGHYMLHEAAAMENFQNDRYSCRWAKRRKIAPAITEQPPCSVDHLPAFIQYIHGSRHESCEGFRISL